MNTKNIKALIKECIKEITQSDIENRFIKKLNLKPDDHFQIHCNYFYKIKTVKDLIDLFKKDKFSIKKVDSEKNPDWKTFIVKINDDNQTIDIVKNINYSVNVGDYFEIDQTLILKNVKELKKYIKDNSNRVRKITNPKYCSFGTYAVEVMPDQTLKVKFKNYDTT